MRVRLARIAGPAVRRQRELVQRIVDRLGQPPVVRVRPGRVKLPGPAVLGNLVRIFDRVLDRVLHGHAAGGDGLRPHRLEDRPRRALRTRPRLVRCHGERAGDRVAAEQPGIEPRRELRGDLVLNLDRRADHRPHAGIEERLHLRLGRAAVEEHQPRRGTGRKRRGQLARIDPVVVAVAVAVGEGPHRVARVAGVMEDEHAVAMRLQRIDHLRERGPLDRVRLHRRIGEQLAQPVGLVAERRQRLARGDQVRERQHGNGGRRLGPRHGITFGTRLSRLSRRSVWSTRTRAASGCPRSIQRPIASRGSGRVKYSKCPHGTMSAAVADAGTTPSGPMSRWLDSPTSRSCRS